jgi:hypothetical protein
MCFTSELYIPIEFILIITIYLLNFNEKFFRIIDDLYLNMFLINHSPLNFNKDIPYFLLIKKKI